METSLIILIIVILFFAFLWLLPFIMILKSDRTSGNEKLAWLLALLCISWFAWIFYLLLAPLKKR